MVLGQVSDQATLDALSTALLDIQDRGDLAIGELATTHRASTGLGHELSYDQYNAAGKTTVITL